MPDTKSGIKHLSNMTSMHQNIFHSLRNVFTKQFKSNMKVYSQEMNVIKDELVRLNLEKERYIKQGGGSHIKSMDLSSGSTNTPENEPHMTRKEAFEEIRRQNELTNEALAKKVQSYSSSPSSRRWSASTIVEVDEDALEVNGTETSSRYRRGSGYGRSSVKEELRESDEEESSEESMENDDNNQRRKPRIAIPKIKTFYKPTFRNDRYVNTTVNDARAKLTALYRQSVLGPSSLKKHSPLIVPSLSSSSRSSAVGTKWQSDSPQPPTGRSQSAVVPKSQELDLNNREFQRKSKSARPEIGRPSSITFNERFENESTPSRKRDKYLKHVQEDLKARYKNFEESLRRRMTIREMKAAEYDANHTIRSSMSLHEVIPSKSSAMSEALRRQSAILALERSILGGNG